VSEKVFTVAAEASTLVRVPILPAQIVTYESGLEQRNRVWQFPRFRFDLHWEYPLSDVQVSSIMGFFIEHGGNFESFLFLPQSLGAATDVVTGQVLGKGNGTRTLYRVYGNRVGSVHAIYLDGSSTGAWTASLTNGTVTLTTAPSSGVLVTADVSSERYVVRFAEDAVQIEWVLYKLARLQTLTLLQEKGLA
jgi:uncharacterized protein (TIGR02217 family)